MKFRITDNVSGKTLVISGDKAPTEQEAEQLFQQSGVREQPKQGGILQGKALPIGGAVTGGLVGGLLGPGGAAAGAGAGYMGGDVIRKILGGMTGQQNQPSEPLQNIGETALGAGVSGVLGYGGNVAGNLGKEIITGAIGSKSFSPIKIASWLREQAVGKAGNLNTTKLLEAGDKLAASFPDAQETWNALKPTISKSMPASDLLYKMSNVFGQAYSRTGAVKDTANASLMNQLYQGGKQVIAQQAPEVAKYTTGMRNILSAPQNIQKLTWLLAKLGLAKGAF